MCFIHFVSASGSGKSTIAALLARQYDVPQPTSLTNNILLANLPLSSYRISFLRSQLSIVSQDPQLFAGSILENVAIGLTGTDRELRLDGTNIDQVRMWCQDALEKAQAWAFVQRLPKGMDTILTRNDLSGGQKQRSVSLTGKNTLIKDALATDASYHNLCRLVSDRVAIARALVRRPKCLILDESSSDLDSRTESNLMRALKNEREAVGMTVM